MFVAISSALILTPALAFAAVDAKSTGLAAAGKISGLMTACANGTNCIAIIVGKILATALSFLGILFLGLLLYAGFLWMTSGGEEERAKKARQMIGNAVAGLIIIVASYVITNYVMEQVINVVNSANESPAPTTRPAGT